MTTVNRSKYAIKCKNHISKIEGNHGPFETYFDPFSGTMIEDIGDDDVFVAERDVKIPEGMLVPFIEN